MASPTRACTSDLDRKRPARTLRAAEWFSPPPRVRPRVASPVSDPTPAVPLSWPELPGNPTPTPTVITRITRRGRPVSARIRVGMAFTARRRLVPVAVRARLGRQARRPPPAGPSAKARCPFPGAGVETVRVTPRRLPGQGRAGATRRRRQRRGPRRRTEGQRPAPAASRITRLAKCWARVASARYDWAYISGRGEKWRLK